MSHHPLRNKKISCLTILLTILFGLLFLSASALISVSIWYQATFDMGFADLLATIMSPLEGTGENTMKQIFSACAHPVILLTILYGAGAYILLRKTPKGHPLRGAGAILCITYLLLSLMAAAFAFRLPAYLKNTFTPSTLYETEYVDPGTVAITDKDGNAKNLIYIYLESMETTYASEEAGGGQKGVNYIPHLTELAKQNTSFSHHDRLGGFRSINGTGWTMGSLMGTTSGVPFSLAVFGKKSHNSQGKNGSFVNGLTTLGDILAEKGYQQEFLCGSDSKFAGRNTYFTVHGNYTVFDYHSAIQAGYIPEDYYVFWGLEDAILFEIAKDELTKLAADDRPFNFTMLTVDAHHVGGYRCALCEDEYEVSLANVISCQDRQVKRFIDWCKEQDFYENTTIVIVGDHPRMDKILIDETLTIADRTMYNCILNAVVSPVNTQNRTFTTTDLFPTVLAAMGFEVEGDRLGLGTNLFSSEPTLCEKYGGYPVGYDFLDAEVSKPSDYYQKHFVKNK